MKNNAFKITLYSGIIMFTLIILLSISVLLNVYNFVEPKIFKLINYEKEKYIDTISTSNENLIMEVNLSEFDTIPKSIKSDSQPKIFVEPIIESKPKKTIKVDIPNNDTSSIKTNKTELVTDSVVKSF
jgi:hypothetical protein